MLPDLQAQLAAFQQKIMGLGGDHRSQLINRAKELVTLQEQALEEAGQELLEFVRPNETMQITTLDQLRQRAGREIPGRLPLYSYAYPEALKDAGLADVRLIGDFPITTVVIGYTRNQRDAGKATIRAFSRLRQDDPRTPLFVDTTETEALLFQLDPARVLRWLAHNRLATAPLPDASDEPAIRAWLLNRIGSVNPFDEIPEEETITRAVYGLVHSFSHLVLRQAVIQSGFDRTSLGEYLFPRSLSFVLYTNNRSRFAIGGLYTLFEQTLHEHLRAVVDKSQTCFHDPLCLGEKGACHICMHISELSCQHFNRNLSRKYLFGRIEPDRSEFIGYWDKRCDS